MRAALNDMTADSKGGVYFTKGGVYIPTRRARLRSTARLRVPTGSS